MKKLFKLPISTVCLALALEVDSQTENHTSSISQWRALVVDKVSLSNFAKPGSDARRELPTELVKLPVDDMSKVAVVSWRWDTDEPGHYSRNIWIVVQLAKQRGVRHLFIDFISVDQQLPLNELPEQVVAFSILFEEIPVIAAYDQINSDFTNTVRRPWVTNEVQAFRRNRTKIVYVSHNNQGAAGIPFSIPDMWALPSGPSAMGYTFTSMVDRIWKLSLTSSALGVLLGEIGMKSYTDFKFLLPVWAPVLIAAEKKMC